MAAYTDKQKIELINTICERISERRSLRSVLTDEGMPHHATFFSWIDKNDKQLAQYARATSLRADAIFEDIMEISDKQGDDIIVLENGNEIINHNVIQRSRLMVDSRKWMLSKMNPKKYGDRLNVESPDGSMTPQTGLETKTFEELYRLKYGKKPE